MSKHISILYVEDNVDDIDLMTMLFNRSNLDCTLKSVDRLHEVKSELEKDVYDLVISDFEMREFTGDEVLDLVKDYDPFLPVIIISGTVGEERAVHLMKNGASDFILKENLKELLRQVFRVIETAKHNRISQKNKEKSEQQSNILHTLMGNIEDFIFLKDINRRYLKVNKALARHFDIDEASFEGRKDEELGFDILLKESEHTDFEVLHNGKTVVFEVDYIDHSGNRVVLETVKSPIFLKGKVDGLVGVSRNITQKKIFEEEVNKNQMILNQAEWITKSASFQYDLETDLISTSKNFNKLMEIPLLNTSQISFKRLTQFIHESDRSLFVSSLESAIAEGNEFNMEFRYVTKLGNPGFAKIIVTPDITSSNSMYFGTIVDITSDRSNFLALETIQEKERKEIARELHDNIGQKLSAAKMYLDHVKGSSIDGVELTNVCDKVYDLIHQCVHDTRAISREMSTKLVEENGLKDALFQLVHFLPETLEVEMEIDFDDSSIDGHVGGNVFRIVQEAITNTMKYAEATKFHLQIVQQPDYLDISLSDNGKGFELNEGSYVGNGLKNIEQRVKTCNGILRVASGHGLGTTISAKLPPV
jgi:PAS domain S-box-containing protein